MINAHPKIIPDLPRQFMAQMGTYILFAGLRAAHHCRSSSLVVEYSAKYFQAELNIYLLMKNNVRFEGQICSFHDAKVRTSQFRILSAFMNLKIIRCSLPPSGLLNVIPVVCLASFGTLDNAFY